MKFSFAIVFFAALLGRELVVAAPMNHAVSAGTHAITPLAGLAYGEQEKRHIEYAEWNDNEKRAVFYPELNDNSKTKRHVEYAEWNDDEKRGVDYA